MNEAAVFLVIFDAPGRQIAIRRLDGPDFSFADGLTSSQVEGYLSKTNQGTVRALK